MVDYLDQLIAAIEFIETNLETNIKVETVASQSGYSPYHFHRVFRSALGESVAEYIRRRRLALASRKLLDSDIPLSRIAMEAAFESQEAFSRAFKKMYGTTPLRFRKNQAEVPIIDDSTFSRELLEHLNGGVTMEPEYKELDKALLAVGLGESFKIGEFEEIAKLWQTFESRRHEIEDIDPKFSLGICLEQHPDIPIEDGDKFIYIAAYSVSSDEKIPDGMNAVTIPAGKYAVFTHRGPIDKMTQTVNYIWGTWIPRNSDKVRKGPDFEYYDDRFNPQTLEGEVDIYIPVV